LVLTAIPDAVKAEGKVIETALSVKIVAVTGICCRFKGIVGR